VAFTMCDRASVPVVAIRGKRTRRETPRPISSSRRDDVVQAAVDHLRQVEVSFDLDCVDSRERETNSLSERLIIHIINRPHARTASVGPDALPLLHMSRIQRVLIQQRVLDVPVMAIT